MLSPMISSKGIVGPGTIRPLPTRSIRARADAGTDALSETVKPLVNNAVETVATDTPIAEPGLAPPQPPTSALASVSADSLPLPTPSVPQTSDVPQISLTEDAVPETLDMKDILPEVRGPDVEPSVADKVESIFSKASTVFQKMQPDTQADKVPEPSAFNSDLFNLAERLQGIKEAAADMAKAPQQGGTAVPPESSANSTPLPSPPTSNPSFTDALVTNTQSVKDALPEGSVVDASALSGTVEAGNKAASATDVTEIPAGPGVVSRALEYKDDVIDRAEGMVGSFIDNATGQATNMMQSVGEGVYNSMPKSLPPNLQTKADVIGGNIAAAKEVYDEAPGVYLLLAALAIGSSAYAYWKFEYGGYKGMYSPVDLLEALNREENVFVVDIRPEEDITEKGVLDLKRRARGKATHLPLVDVPDAVKGDIENSQKLQLQLNAALVTSLNEVNRFTKIVVMDSRGTSVKGLARAITEQGYRGYMLRGGFSAWKTGGLATKFGSYTVTPADLLADKGEELSEAAEQTAEKLRQPRNAALALLTFASAVAVYLYPHESFRLIGVLGIELTILVKLLSYDSPSAAVDDVSKGFQSIKDSFSSAKAQAAEFAEVAQARSAATPQPPVPEKPQETPKTSTPVSEAREKSSPVSEARESVAAEAVKEAQAALERMVAQSKQDKPPPVPAPQASTKPWPKKPADRKTDANQSTKIQTLAKQPTVKPATPAAQKASGDGSTTKSVGKWPAEEKKDEVVPPKPVVDSLPYVSAEDKAKKRQTGQDGAKPAAKGK